MSTAVAVEDTLVIELEDSLTRLPWYSPTRLFSQTSMQQWHFVGLLGGELRYESPTFAAPYSWGGLPMGRTRLPREEWAPGMEAALEELRAEISADGWTEVGCGEQPWQHRYRRDR
jgi:hypothetical protein